MIALGVDMQGPRIVACLREGNDPLWPPVLVDDGCSIVRDDAMVSANSWQQFAARLSGFVGAGATDAYRLQVTIARLPVHSADEADRAAAGFGNVRETSPGKAALLTALRNEDIAVTFERKVTVVVIGDEQVEISGYRVVLSGKNRLSASSAAAPILIEKTGKAYWCDDVIRGVEENVPEHTSKASEQRTLFAAAHELGLRLNEAESKDDLVPWNGPLRDWMVLPFQLNQRTAFTWESVRRLAEYFPFALLDTLRSLGEKVDGSAQIILAGSGAAWPFAAKIAGDFGQVNVLPEPHLALARGAAWWSGLGERIFDGYEAPNLPRGNTSSTEPAKAREIVSAKWADLSIIAQHGGCFLHYDEVA